MRRRLPHLAALGVGLLGLTTGAVWATNNPSVSLPPPTTASPGPSSTTRVPTTTVAPHPSTTTHSGPTTSTTLGLRLPTERDTTTSTLPGGSTTTSTTSTTVAPAGGDRSWFVGVIPPDAAAAIAHYRVTPPGNDAPLLGILDQLTSFGLTPTQAAMLGLGRFPIAGPATWADSFLEPRFSDTGAFSFHHAIDIPAACGTPLRAPDEGVLTQGSDPGGGTTVEITEPDGTYMYLAHLSGYAAGVNSGDHVRIGELIGYVGQTGDATGCHLHLEIHPQGGQPIDPKPFVDAWYGDALAEAPILVDAMRADHRPAAANGLGSGDLMGGLLDLGR